MHVRPPTLSLSATMVSSGVQPAFPPLQFSGTGAPGVEEFVAALEAQLTITGCASSLRPGHVAAHLTGRALLWYAETTKTYHFRNNDDGYRDLRGRLVASFALRESTPHARFRALTQGAGSPAEYAAKYRQLAQGLDEDLDGYFNRMWWAYGLRPELRDFALDRMLELESFAQLSEELHRAHLLVPKHADTQEAPASTKQPSSQPAGCRCDDKGAAEDDSCAPTVERKRTQSDRGNGNADTEPTKGDAELVKLFGELLKAHLLSTS